MALIEMIMPKMGESIFECIVLNWLKNVGDKIEADDKYGDYIMISDGLKYVKPNYIPEDFEQDAEKKKKVLSVARKWG